MQDAVAVKSSGSPLCDFHHRREIANSSTVMVTIENTGDIVTKLNSMRRLRMMLNIRVREVFPRGCLRHEALDRRWQPPRHRVAEAKRPHNATKQMFDTDCL